MDLNTIVTQAEAQLLRDGQHPPTVVVALQEVPGVVRVPLPPLPGTPQQRQHVLFLRGKQFASRYGTQHIARLWFICEAWLSEADPHASQVLAPSLDPRRREALLVVEVDASSEGLPQQMDVRVMRRTRSGVLKALQPLPELSSPDLSSMPIGVPALAFLTGFAEASTDPHAYGPVHSRMVWHQLQMERRFGNRTSW